MSMAAFAEKASCSGIPALTKSACSDGPRCDQWL